MHLNDLCTGNQFNGLIQQTYSTQQIDATQQQTIQTNIQSNTINHQLGHSADETSQLNSSLSSSSGVGCTSTNSSGLGTSSLFSNSSLSSSTAATNQTATMNGSNNGSFVNVLLPLADMNSHNVQRAQLISNLNGSNNQYTTLAFTNYTNSNTSTPSSVNTNLTTSTLPSNLPIHSHQQASSHSNKVYTQNGQLLSDSVYCQTSFNGAIIESNLPTHYQLLSNKQHHNSNYYLQTVPSNQAANYTNLHPPSINSYLNHDELNKYPNAQFDLICDNRLSPVYSKLSPNSNSLIKECLITNAENARNASKFIELTSSQNSSSTVYSDALDSKLATSSKDSLKLIKAANTGLDLLNCDKSYTNEMIKSGDLKSCRTDSVLSKCKCSKEKCSCPSKCLKGKSIKDQRQLSTKVAKRNAGCCCLSNDNPKKQGICFIILATCILIFLICFFYSLTSPATRNLLVESGLLPQSIRQRLYNESANKNRFQPDSSSDFFTPQRPFHNETIFSLNGPRPSLDYSDSLLQQQQQQSSTDNSHFFYQSFSSSSPLARTYSSNQNAQSIGMQDNNIPQIYQETVKDETNGDMFGNPNTKLTDERNLPKNVKAQAGHNVYLHCIVEPIGDKMVSWIRLKDFYLLTVGTFTYTSDSRFSVKQISNNDWTLQILRLTTHDQGIYECQLNTDPPRSQFYNLIVLVPYAIIQDNVEEIEVRPGDLIELTCIISRSPIPPSFVFWYHEQRMINFDLNNAKARGKINLFKRNERDDTVVSKLIIFNAISGDSGNYTCAPSNSAPTSIYVQVLQGERRLSNEQNDNNLNDNSITNRQIRMQNNASNAQINKFIFQLTLICLLLRSFVQFRQFFR